MRYNLLYPVALLVILLAHSCKKDDYLTGGSLHNAKVDATTYDYLKANPLFDSLILLVDRAGLKEELNGNITFFAPTDYSIRLLMENRTIEIQIKYNDDNIKYTIDSFPVAELKDSLRAYMLKGSINRNDLSLKQQQYKNVIGEDYAVRLRESSDYTDLLSERPRYVYVTKVINGLDPDPVPDDLPDEDKDKESKVQTSGIITNTGILHVIENVHTFYWR